MDSQYETKELSIQIRASKCVDKYPAKSHARRIAEKLGRDHGLIVLAATKAANWPNSDMPAPFRQDRYFYYMTGVNEPDCFVSYSIEDDVLTLWLPPINEDRVLWYGRGSTTEEAMERYDIDDARYLKEKSFERALGRMCGLTDTMLLTLGKRPHEPSGLRTAIDACRVIKDLHEIDLIRRANVISGEAHVNVMKGLHRFTNEADVEAAFMQTCIARHAKIQAYDPIAGSGANAAVLHYSENEADFGDGQTIVLDAGCEVERYASDVTRTMPINPRKPGYWPSREAEEIYNLVESIQESCIGQLKPGKEFREVFWHAHHMVIDGLLKLGILKGDRDDIFHTGTSRAFLPHGLGHHVGLEVHDVDPTPNPSLSTEEDFAINMARLREAYIAWNPAAAGRVSTLTQPSHFALALASHSDIHKLDAHLLERDMIITVEPGIYFNEFLIEHFYLSKPEHAQFIDKKVLKRYMQVGGVRIEDNLLITKDGCENVTTAPKGKAMLRIIREAASSQH